MYLCVLYKIIKCDIKNTYIVFYIIFTAVQKFGISKILLLKAVFIWLKIQKKQ